MPAVGRCAKAVPDRRSNRVRNGACGAARLPFRDWFVSSHRLRTILQRNVVEEKYDWILLRLRSAAPPAPRRTPQQRGDAQWRSGALANGFPACLMGAPDKRFLCVSAVPCSAAMNRRDAEAQRIPCRVSGEKARGATAEKIDESCQFASS